MVKNSRSSARAILLVLLLGFAGVLSISVAQSGATPVWLHKIEEFNVLSVGTVMVYAHSSTTGQSLQAECTITEAGIYGKTYSGTTPYSREVMTTTGMVTCTYQGVSKTQPFQFTTWGENIDAVFPLNFVFDTGEPPVQTMQRTLNVKAYKVPYQTSQAELIDALVTVYVEDEIFSGSTGGQSYSLAFDSSVSTVSASVVCSYSGDTQSKSVTFLTGQPTAFATFYFTVYDETPWVTETPTPTSSPQDRIHVADTYGLIRVHFKDGNVKEVTSSMSEASLAYELVTPSEAVESLDFEVAAINLDIELPTKTYGIGPFQKEKEADHFLLYVKGEFHIYVNGEEEFASPDNGEELYMTDVNDPLTSFAFGISGMKKIDRGQKYTMLFSKEGWSPDKYVQEANVGDQISYTVSWSLYWELFALWDQYSYVFPIIEKWYTPTSISDQISWSDTVTQELKEGDPLFTVALTPKTKTIGIERGSTQYFHAVAQAYNGFNSPITFSVIDLPNGISSSFDRNDQAPTLEVTLIDSMFTLSASSGTELGTYYPKLKGEGGGHTAYFDFTLVVNQTAEPDDPWPKPKLKTEIEFTTTKKDYGRSEYFTLEGRIKDASGDPVFDVTIKISSDFGFQEDVTSNSEGKFKAIIKTPNMTGNFQVKASCQSLPDKWALPDDRTFSLRVSDSPLPTDPSELFKWLLNKFKEFIAGMLGFIGIDPETALSWAIFIVLLIIGVIVLGFILWFFGGYMTSRTKHAVSSRRPKYQPTAIYPNISSLVIK